MLELARIKKSELEQDFNFLSKSAFFREKAGKAFCCFRFEKRRFNRLLLLR